MATVQTSVRVDVQTRATGVVARVTIDNASKLNIVGSALMAEFVAKVTAIGERADLRAAVLTGAGGRAFIGGADIREMAELDPARAREFIAGLHCMCAALRDLPVPVIARIDGYALGAGLEVAAACDLRVAAANAVFGMPEVRVGIPSVIEAALLPGLIGWGRTRDCCSSARPSTPRPRSAGAWSSASCRPRAWTRQWRRASTPCSRRARARRGCRRS